MCTCCMECGQHTTSLQDVLAGTDGDGGEPVRTHTAADSKGSHPMRQAIHAELSGGWCGRHFLAGLLNVCGLPTLFTLPASVIWGVAASHSSPLDRLQITIAASSHLTRCKCLGQAGRATTISVFSGALFLRKRAAGRSHYSGWAQHAHQQHGPRAASGGGGVHTPEGWSRVPTAAGLGRIVRTRPCGGGGCTAPELSGRGHCLNMRCSMPQQRDAGTPHHLGDPGGAQEARGRGGQAKGEEPAAA